MKWIQKVMQGRSGIDHLSVFLLIIGLILQLLLQLLPWPGFIFLAYIPTISAIWRALSKNKIKRHQENILFLKYWYPVQSKIKNKYREINYKLKEKREYRHFKCKSCKQKMRIPRKVKRAKVTCPNCKETFINETFWSKITQVFKRKA